MASLISTKVQDFVLNVAQTNALNAIRKNRLLGMNKGVVILPTGTGKTYVSAIDAKKNGTRVLYLAHQEQILRQARKAFDKLTDFETSFYIGDEKNISEATFATIQTMTRHCQSFNPKTFDYIVVDECHHSQTTSYRKVINHFKPKYLLGLTATPWRMDNKDIFKIVGKPYYTMKIREAIEKNLLAKINYYYVDNDIDFTKINMINNRYDEKDLNKKLLIPKYDKAILSEYLKSAKGKKTIFFCVSVEHTERLKKLFEKNGIKCAIAHSKMDKNEIRRNIGQFFTGKLNTIFVRDLFNEGIDVPSCECIVLLRPTESKVIFEQQLGRGLRITRKKKEVLILDFTANSFNNKLNLEFLNNLSSGTLNRKLYDSVNANYREKKEIFVYDKIGSIRLNKSKIDILRNFIGNIEARKQKMIENYLELKKKLKRIPSAKDMRLAHLPYGFSYDSYRAVFGSWNQFKKYMKDEQKTIGKDRIIKQITEFKQKYGHYPKVRELRKYAMISDNTIRRVFGSHEKAILEAGGTNEDINKHMNVTKESFLKDFYSCKKVLGKVPFQIEFEKFTGYHTKTFLDKYFGKKSYINFLKSINEKPQKRADWTYQNKNKRKGEYS